MKDSEKVEFAKILAILCETYDRAMISEGVVNIYFEALSEFSIMEISAAAKLIIRQSSYFPRPADFLNILNPPTAASLEVEANEAWPKMIAALHDGRKYPEEGSILDLVIDQLGGPGRLGDMDTRDINFLRRDFIKAYIAQATVAKHTDLVKHITAGAKNLKMLK